MGSLGLGYMIAGGARALGEEIEWDRRNQQLFELEQRGLDAQAMRQQNFTRFNFDLQERVMKTRSQLETQSYGDRRALDYAYSPTNYEDPKTGAPMTVQGLQDRGSKEGLVDSRVANMEATTDLEIARRDKLFKAKEQKVIDEYGEGSEKHKAFLERELLGSAAEKPVSESQASKNFNRLVKDMAKEIDASPDVAEMIAALEVVNKLPEAERAIAMNSEFYKEAIGLERLASQVMKAREDGKTRQQVIDQLKKNGLSETDIDDLFEFLEATGNLKRGRFKFGSYKGKW